MTTYVHLICDYMPGDLAWSEVISAFWARLPHDVKLHVTAVGAFDTIATGFSLAQLCLADRDLRPENLMVFANCAPRKDLTDARRYNEGEGLLFAQLNNGVEVLAVNSGYSLSFITAEIKELYSTTAREHGSQFRSRDFFPQLVGLACKHDYSFKGKRMDPKATIPKAPDEVIGYIDCFGNIKTTYRSDDAKIAALPAGGRIKVTIGSAVRTATVSTGIFNVMEGDLAFAPGSSGHDKRYWELFKRGGSAWREFMQPTTGTKVLLESA